MKTYRPDHVKGEQIYTDADLNHEIRAKKHYKGLFFLLLTGWGVGGGGSELRENLRQFTVPFVT